MARILAVDDMRSMRDLVKSVLEKHGHQVDTCDDGQTALKFAETNNVDLVITDINMPNMSGLELVPELRKLPGYRSTPILMLTTEDSTDKKQTAKIAGANGWIQKPFNPERLLAAVETTMARQ
ncbi:MAG: two-component system chemotaxis response regulator CheY [Gammaproteobacteria bacterium]|jgi:two-component system chemotaxis response regulator CheY